MANPTLYTWGAIPFQAYPLSVTEVQHVTSTDWARKEIAGAAIYREWVGENDEELHFRGEVYPHFFARKARERSAGVRSLNPKWTKGYGWTSQVGVDVYFGQENSTGISEQGWAQGGNVSSGGLGHLDVMDNMRRLGQAHVLTRSDGWHLGWFVIDKLHRAHAYLAKDGIGQQIKFEVTFQRVPIPRDNLAYFPAFWGQVSP